MRIKLTRVSAGTYSWKDASGTVWIIEALRSEQTYKPTGYWTYRRDTGTPDDLFASKADAVNGLIELLNQKGS